jgi:hypothetical protein
MPDYQLRVLDISYALDAQLNAALGWSYQQRLNGVGTCSIPLAFTDPKTANVDLMASGAERLRRIQIIRNGVHVFGGLLELSGWTLPGTIWSTDGGDYGLYLQWRKVEPASGHATYDVTAAADDAMKALVYNHAGAGADADRRFAGLTVAADAGAAPSYPASEAWTTLFDAVNKVAAQNRVYWRLEPTASGCTFTTGYTIYGLDRQRNNGVNAECIFSIDRHNWQSIAWQKDRTAHRNHVYVGGSGEGTSRRVREVEDATSVAALLRREEFVDESQVSSNAGLDARGAASLREMIVSETMDVDPVLGSWKATTGTTWDLGDCVDVDIYPDGGRHFTTLAVITGIDVTVTPDGTESVKPILEARPDLRLA